jgi:hypothetical protein
VDRRVFLGIAWGLGATLSPAVRHALAASAGRPTRDPGARALSEAQRALVEAFADRIIPETDTPGAVQAGVGDYIELMLREGFLPEDRDHFLQGLAALERLCMERYHKPYVLLGAAEQDALMQVLDEEAERWRSLGNARGPDPVGADAAPRPPVFVMLKELTVIGYYTSEIGAAQELRFVPVPGRYVPCVSISSEDRAFSTSSGLDTTR